VLGASHTPAGKENESPTRYTRFQRPPNTVNVRATTVSPRLMTMLSGSHRALRAGRGRRGRREADQSSNATRRCSSDETRLRFQIEIKNPAGRQTSGV
jgi:hypothetical protein